MAVGPIIGIIFAILVIIFVFTLIALSIKIVKEKEEMIIERFGKFHMSLLPGVHFIIPFVDWPKKYKFHYWVESLQGNVLKEGSVIRISTQNEVLDFPKQRVITRDNASVTLDAVLSYKITNARQMIYSVNNLPYVLTKLLQAQMRNVAGSLDIDQIIEESSSLNVLTGLLDNETAKWGVKILFVKIQKVEAYQLNDVLAKKKTADLQNKEIIINAKAKKQTQVIEAEGIRDSMIKKAEGQAQEVLSAARGEAQAIINAANAEAKSIREIAHALTKDSNSAEDKNRVIRYLLATKYIEALRTIVSTKGTEVKIIPNKSSYLQTVADFKLNTILPPSSYRSAK